MEEHGIKNGFSNLHSSPPASGTYSAEVTWAHPAKDSLIKILKHSTNMYLYII